MVAPFQEDDINDTGGAGENKKIPGAFRLQGRIVDPRYHPAYLPGEIPSGSSKPYPGNGGNRVPLLKPRSFTGPTQEPDLRARSTGSHHTPALCSIETGRIFPSMSLRCIQLTLKHKQSRLSTGFCQENVYKYTGGNSVSFCETRGLTFSVRRAKVWSSKRISQTAVTKTVRQLEFAESQRLVQADSPTPQRPITSEPVCRAKARHIRLPALRDRTCWSLKVAAMGRNLSGTAGIVFTRLKKKRSSWGVFYFDFIMKGMIL